MSDTEETDSNPELETSQTTEGRPAAAATTAALPAKDPLSLPQLLTLCEQSLVLCTEVTSKLKDEEEKALVSVAVDKLATASLIWQQRSLAEISALKQALLESRQREVQWKELGDVFAEYRTKLTDEIGSLKEVVAGYKVMKVELQKQLSLREQEIVGLNEELAYSRDFILRFESIKRRRAHLNKLQEQIDGEEASMLDQLSEYKEATAELAAAAAAKVKE